MIDLEVQVKELQSQNKYAIQQADKLSVTIHELENRLKDLQFQKEQLQHEMKVLQ